jgi:raffinose/stachyose/melibiose transport system substrate-binding protein
VSANSPTLTNQLYTSKKIVDFTDKPAAKNIVPVATSAIGALYNGKTIVLPTELNIEGIWYNKSLLSKAGITAPTSWTDLVSSFKTLKGKGTQPIVDAGKGGDGWGITRWVGAYLYRSLGPDALKDIKSGKAKLTDAKYVKAADEIAALGKAGYFGSPATVDYATALNSFLTGKAAYYYMGSWAVSAFNDPKQNKIGADNIGFIPFPTVPGGTGTADQTPTNVGTDIAFSADAYKNPKVAKWADCIAANYGAEALKVATQITGFTVNGDVTVPPLTKQAQTQIANTKTSVQWFEALFGPGATTASQNNGGLLGSGQLTGANFMSTVSSKLAG